MAEFDVEVVGHLLASSGWVRPEYSASRLVVTFSMSCASSPTFRVAAAGEVSRRVQCRTPRSSAPQRPRFRPEMGVRADHGAVADLGVVADGVLDDGAVADRAVVEPGVGADVAAVTDHGGSLQDRARVQRDVAADRTVTSTKVWRGSSIVTPLSSQNRLVRARSSRSASASCQRSLTPCVSPSGACTQPMRCPIAPSTDTTSVR